MANEKRLIDAHDLWSDIMMLPYNGDMISSDEEEQAIKDASAADDVEVVHGKWIEHRPNVYECTACHTWYGNYGGNEEWRYCPNCGAKMDGDGNA